MRIGITADEFEDVKGRVDLARATMYADKHSNDPVQRYFAGAALLISLRDDLQAAFPDDYKGVAAAIEDVLERIHIPPTVEAPLAEVVDLFPRQRVER